MDDDMDDMAAKDPRASVAMYVFIHVYGFEKIKFKE